MQTTAPKFPAPMFEVTPEGYDRAAALAKELAAQLTKAREDSGGRPKAQSGYSRRSYAGLAGR